MYKLDKRVLERMRSGQKVTIVTLGDSVTEGGYLKYFGEKKAFAEIWEEQLQAGFKNPKIKVVNKGIDSATARDGYNSFYQVIDKNPNLITVMFGHNDRDVKADPEIFKKYIRKIILGLRQNTDAQILLLTPNALLDPDYDSKTFPYLKALKEVGKELRVELADVHKFFEKKFSSDLNRRSCFYKASEFLKAGYKHIDQEELHLQVIVHPNQRGHQLIAEALLEFEEARR